MTDMMLHFIMHKPVVVVIAVIQMVRFLSIEGISFFCIKLDATLPHITSNALSISFH
jgi:hypothetical protein